MSKEKIIETIQSLLPDIHRNNIPALMAEGKIEQLTRDGREPLLLGTMGTDESNMKPRFQIPPRGFNWDDRVAAFDVYKFRKNDRGQLVGGIEFVVSEEQAQEILKRVNAEMDRLEQD